MIIVSISRGSAERERSKMIGIRELYIKKNLILLERVEDLLDLDMLHPLHTHLSNEGRGESRITLVTAWGWGDGKVLQIRPWSVYFSVCINVV
jgi:hypothetical protein